MSMATEQLIEDLRDGYLPDACLDGYFDYDMLSESELCGRIEEAIAAASMIPCNLRAMFQDRVNAAIAEYNRQIKSDSRYTEIATFSF